MKYWFSFAWIVSISAFADIGLVYPDGRVAAIYADKNQVIYRGCLETEINNLTRSCQTGALRSYTYERSSIHVRLKALSRIPERYQGTDGLEKIQKEIEYYQGQKYEPLGNSAKEMILVKLPSLRNIQNTLITLETDILAYLVAGRNRTIEKGLDEQDEFHRITYSLYPVWFDGEKRWYIPSTKVHIDDLFKSCIPPWRSATSSDFNASPTGSPNREAILKSPLAPSLSEGGLVWTSYWNQYGGGADYLGHRSPVDRTTTSGRRGSLYPVACIWE
ncbi:MAG: hypothetical protein HYR96_08145 [Deltaproteobacteria bacterium]|nr:hypothetical protein [Deltaproteobacteria bacterium]MBI3293478.1 hypothetical protein [Deltaproteobacteria bacterium]